MSSPAPPVLAELRCSHKDEVLPEGALLSSFRAHSRREDRL